LDEKRTYQGVPRWGRVKKNPRAFRGNSHQESAEQKDIPEKGENAREKKRQGKP